jgi:hypothetical protein
MVDQLRDVVGPQVIVDQDVIASYTTDRTRRFVGRTAAVVRPGSTEEWRAWWPCVGRSAWLRFSRAATPVWWVAGCPCMTRCF